jgi:predicted Rossmann fold nucleotide-binding protein DprA/Smf involved in DNA uptake
MSEHLKTLPTEDLHAEILRRKAGEVSAMREAIAGHRSAITALEVKVTAYTGEKAPKATRTRGAKVDPVEVDRHVMEALKHATDGEKASASSIAEFTGIAGPALKASLARLEADGKIKRSGKARATVYGVA